MVGIGTGTGASHGNYNFRLFMAGPWRTGLGFLFVTGTHSVGQVSTIKFFIQYGNVEITNND